MSLFGDLFRNKKKSESVILIDISAASIAGAYAQYAGGEPPAILYTRRFPVEVRGGEPPQQAMLRALRMLGDALIREGAPALARATGSGSAETILVSVDAPWQKTSVCTEHFEQDTPFVFTKKFIAAAMEKAGILSVEEPVDKSVIGAILNGYETRHPYGKTASRAAVVILSSIIDGAIAKEIISTLQSIYHTKRILPIAGSSLRYQAMHDAFPHEHNALIIDAMGRPTSIAIVRKGLLVATVEVPDAGAWVEQVGNELAGLAKHYPLPRTIFLLARQAEMASMRSALDSADLKKLWLSDNPPKVVAVVGNHIAGLVRQVSAASPDLPLLLMALFWRSRIQAEDRNAQDEGSVSS